MVNVQLSGLFEFISINWNEDWWVTLIKLALWIIVIGGLLIKSTDHVDEGHLALRRRGGKVVRHRWGNRKNKAVVVPAGQKILIPFLHSLWKTNTQRRIMELAIQTREIDGHWYHIHFTIEFRIFDVEQALVVCEDLDASLRALCARHVMRLIKQNVSNDDLPAQLILRGDPGHKNDWMLLSAAEYEADAFGIRLIELKLTTIAETEQSILAWALRAAGRLPLADAELAALLKPRSNGNGQVPIVDTPIDAPDLS